MYVCICMGILKSMEFRDILEVEIGKNMEHAMETGCT